MLVAASVCPHPPLLVPELAAGAAPELDDLRLTCDRAVEAVLATEPDLLFVVGGGTVTRRHGSGACGSFAPYGVDVRVRLGTSNAQDDAEPVLPLSLSVGAWLLGRTAWRGPTIGQEVEVTAVPEDCRAIGAALGAAADRVGMLVLGDGSARRSRKAPGYEDERAGRFDASVVTALRTGDPPALLSLDPVLADELMVGGRAAWQVLAGAAGDDIPDAAVLYDGAPYGVGYVVAVWEHHG